MSELREKCKSISNYIINETRKTNTPDLTWEWVQEFYYGQMIKDAIPKFQEVWSFCKENGHKSSRSPAYYGDYDAYIWVERTKDEDLKVLIIDDVATCKDNSTFIFVEDGAGGLPLFYRFSCVAVWSRQVTHRQYNFGDHRDIKIPSLSTYRKEDFKWGYRDSRDDGHCFVYEGYDQAVKSAQWHSRDLDIALFDLSTAHSELILDSMSDSQTNE